MVNCFFGSLIEGRGDVKRRLFGFWGPETDSKTGAKSSGHKQIKLRLNEWPPFWGPFLDPKTGAVLSAKFWSPAKKSKSFDCFCAYATEVFHTAAFPWFCSAAGTCSPHPANTHVLELGRPSVAGPVFAGFLDPKLVSRNITFLDPLKEQKSLEHL